MRYSDNYLRIMDISVNLARIGNWTADNLDGKKSLIQRFLSQTEEYVDDLKKRDISEDTRLLLSRFYETFEELKNEKVTSRNKDEWAERALTWANILQHRAKLA